MAGEGNKGEREPFVLRSKSGISLFWRIDGMETK